MGWFKKKPTEIELERIIMQSACIAKAKEYDTSKLTSDSAIEKFFRISCNDLDVKPDKNQLKMAKLSIQALLVEGDFVDELLQFRIKNPDQPLPHEFRSKMLAAVEKSVNEFMRDNR
jgi:hypothetical protein